MPDRPDRVVGHPLGATVAGAVLFVAGLLVAAGTLEVAWKEHDQQRGWREAEGTVVEQIRRHTPSGTEYVPLIAFVTASGERVSFTAPVSDISRYWQGAKVPIVYDPANPVTAKIDAKARRRTRNALAGAAALTLVLLGAYVARYASKVRQA